MSDEQETLLLTQHTFFGIENRTLVIDTDINAEVASELIDQVLVLNGIDTEEPIIIFINSPGGSATDMWAIYDILRYVEAPIITLGIGLVGSAALTIFCAGDQRLAMPNCEFFYHEPILAAEITQSAAIENTSRMYQSLRNKTNKILRDRSNIPDDIWTKHFDNNTSFFFPAEDALEWGIIDKIVPVYTFKEVKPIEEEDNGEE